MAKLYNLAGMSTTTTGTGTITLGSAMYGHLTFAQAGVGNGDTVTYAIKDGAASEIGRGVYTSSGTTLTRTVLKSTNSDAAISLSGSAEVFITPAAEDIIPRLSSTTDNTVPRHDGTAGLLQTSGVTIDDSNNVTGVVALTLSGVLRADDSTSTGAPVYTFDGDTNTGIAHPAADAVAVSTGGTERVRVDASGNVGIGTTAPAARLQVSAPNLGTSSGDYTLIGRLYVNAGNGLFLDFVGLRTSAGSDWTSAGMRIQSIVDTTEQAYIQFNGSGNPHGISFGSGGNAAGYHTVDERMRIDSSGNVGIGTTSPSYQFQLSTDSAAKPSTNTWTISSDERLKQNIVPADLDRCWEIVKGVPLKRYAWRTDAYTAEQTADRSKLGWIAQDVQPFFARAVVPHVFHRPPVNDGVEEYTEQETVERVVERESVEIEIRNGVPTRVAKSVSETVREPVVDMVPVVDEAGSAVLNDDGQPVMHAVPRMITKTRPKTRIDTIDDCLSLNSDQIYAAMYGALQLAMHKLEAFESRAVFVSGGVTFAAGRVEKDRAALMITAAQTAVIQGAQSGDYRWFDSAADFAIADANGVPVKMDAVSAFAYCGALLRAIL